MKKKWPYYIGCAAIPHIMLIVGIIFLSRREKENKDFGMQLCRYSTIVLTLGFLIYYLFFTPIFGLD
ncbi:MAG: hypothetical protein U9Q08_02565 [Candidatus Omnitrophota bacterium]|nr:hypothetical protein [Candidatus Omnitrophota bacterium]